MSLDYKNMLHKDTIFLDVDVNNRDELFATISSKLEDLGYVKSSYSNALSTREDEFPTGLITKYLPIALPHADPENVNEAFIAVVKNSKKIHMLQMGTNEDLEAQYFFFLGITDSSHQVILLQKFMQLLQDKNFVDSLVAVTNENDMFNLLSKFFEN